MPKKKADAQRTRIEIQKKFKNSNFIWPIFFFSFSLGRPKKVIVGKLKDSPLPHTFVLFYFILFFYFFILFYLFTFFGSDRRMPSLYVVCKHASNCYVCLPPQLIKSIVEVESYIKV